MPSVTHSTIARLALAVGVICLLLEMRAISSSAADASAAEAPVLEYLSEWEPDTAVHHPGEDVYFQAKRRSMLHGRNPLPIVIFSSFQNVDTGLTYGLPTVAHIVVNNGDTTITVVRKLPADVLPGRYRLNGWAETHTEKRHSSALFSSKIIEVKSDLPEEAP